MRGIVLLMCVFVSAIAAADIPAVLDGSWILKVENAEHQVITSMTIRFAETPARSCLGGEWKRVLIDDGQSSNEGFFPSDEPLSWQIDQDELTIGRNGTCDAYLQLEARLNSPNMTGDFSSFGLGGSRKEGFFSLTRSDRPPEPLKPANRLIGTWRSDRELSLRFAEKHTALESGQADFLRGVLGKLELTFEPSRMRYRMPAVDAPVQGEIRHFGGSDWKYDYEVLGTDSDSTAIIVRFLYGKDRIWHVHFTADDEFWIYSEDGDYGLRDLNFREYFQRMK